MFILFFKKKTIRLVAHRLWLVYFNLLFRLRRDSTWLWDTLLPTPLLIEAPDGTIIVDVTESMKSGARAFAALREVSKSPVKAIIYTHNHADHVFGAKVRVAVLKTKANPGYLVEGPSPAPKAPKRRDANPILFPKFTGNPRKFKRKIGPCTRASPEHPLLGSGNGNRI